MLGKIDASALQGAKSNLRRTEPLPDRKKFSEHGTSNAGDEEKAIRAITGVKNDEDRVAYYLNGGVDAWFDELRINLEAAKLSINDVTFPTSLVTLARTEKVILHALFKEIFGDVASVEDASDGAKQRIQDSEEYFQILEGKVSEMQTKLSNDDTLLALHQRLDTCIRDRHGSSAFVKLTTRSPKDSYLAFCQARRENTDGAAANTDEPDAGAVSDVDHNALWATFAENLRLAQRMTSGADALLLLATSRRVYEDLTTDLFENPAGNDQIALTVRTFDSQVVPQTEFRGFVWDKKFVCCGQYFHQLYFSELSSCTKDCSIVLADSAVDPMSSAPPLVDQISADLCNFFDKVLAPSIPDFLHRCPCFMMDLVWMPNRVLLTEINPFDGEAVGVFPASTGLFSWDDPEDRQLMMGQKKFELRVRREPLITGENLQKHPALRNLSPLWKKAIYS